MLLLNVIFCLFLLSGFVSAQSKKTFENNLNISIPVLNGTFFDLIGGTEIVAAFQQLKNKKVIWIVGEFKVGKTFLTDLFTESNSPMSSEFYNTLGLTIHWNDKYVIIDTEGMNQPAGDNNPYFVKEFIMNLLTLSADSVVVVGDQMRITDIELYNRLAQIYYSTNIFSMFYIHNCKTLNVQLLAQYKQRAKERLGLNEDYTDESVHLKPITHHFYPKIEIDNSVMGSTKAILEKGWKSAKNYISSFITNSTKTEDEFDHPDIFSNPQFQRKKFTQDAYFEAIEQSLRSLGYEFEVKEEKTRLYLQSGEQLQVDFIPPKIVYCRTEDDKHLAMKIRTGEIHTVSRVDATTINMTYDSYDTNYQIFRREQIIHPPTLVQTHDDQNRWSIYRSKHGFTTVEFPITKDDPVAERFETCDRKTFGEEITFDVLEVPEPKVSKVNEVLEFFRKVFNGEIALDKGIRIAFGHMDL